LHRSDLKTQFLIREIHVRACSRDRVRGLPQAHEDAALRDPEARLGEDHAAGGALEAAEPAEADPGDHATLRRRGSGERNKQTKHTLKEKRDTEANAQPRKKQRISMFFDTEHFPSSAERRFL